MAILVGDDAAIQVAIPLRRGVVPKIHLHPGVLAVDRGGEVGVVAHVRLVGFILGFGQDVVASQATGRVVVLSYNFV